MTGCRYSTNIALQQKYSNAHPPPQISWPTALRDVSAGTVPAVVRAALLAQRHAAKIEAIRAGNGANLKLWTSADSDRSAIMAHLATHPDAELLALNQKLNETVRAYLAIQPAHRDAERRYGEAFRAAFQGVASISDEEFIPRMREAFAPFAADLGPGDSLLTEWDRLSGEIVKNHRPTSLAGVAVVASVVATSHHEEWSKPADDRDWPERIAMQLASAILALAGRENVAASSYAPLQETVSRG